ncbi:MAG: LemA family protein [Gammaproteobacteria bacterium]
MITGNDLVDGLLAFGVIVIAMVWFVTAYNNLDAAAARTAQAWGNVDAMLRQRHDELPRFLDACRPHVQHEQALFDRLLAARDAVFAARQVRDTVALGTAETELRAMLGQLIALVEAHRDSNADDAFGALHKRIALLESGLNERRAIFNDAVQQNNGRVGQFPSNIVALLGGFRSVQSFDVERGQG